MTISKPNRIIRFILVAVLAFGVLQILQAKDIFLTNWQSILFVFVPAYAVVVLLTYIFHKKQQRKADVR